MGSCVIDRLATDLRAEFPTCGVLSEQPSLHAHRGWRLVAGGAIVQQAVGQLPWGHLTVLIDKLDDQVARDWYAAAVENGCSHAVLTHQIRSRLHQRVGAAHWCECRDDRSPTDLDIVTADPDSGASAQYAAPVDTSGDDSPPFPSILCAKLSPRVFDRRVDSTARWARSICSLDRSLLSS
ncbi:DUF1016 N-terminal domain-containing protein [Nocardia sp. 348MFTsu5.1]|uniref:DUF1016 N-terminal domain-containing protein n=1 Tax=Nocardia sp. 348MFTsu5.1 TaxID=1172185 RepID=UPI001E39E46E|nr:DUF1016 N-terminal domain-containing protein [Nocardia sp. 348MFTsu5.1]